MADQSIDWRDKKTVDKVVEKIQAAMTVPTTKFSLGEKVYWVDYKQDSIRSGHVDSIECTLHVGYEHATNAVYVVPETYEEKHEKKVRRHKLEESSLYADFDSAVLAYVGMLCNEWICLQARKDELKQRINGALTHILKTGGSVAVSKALPPGFSWTVEEQRPY